MKFGASSAKQQNGNGESEGGYFDPIAYKSFIRLIGKWDDLDEKPLYSYVDGFPTELLWDENYKNTVKQTLAKDKKEFLEKQKKEELAKVDKNKEIKKRKEKEKILAQIDKQFTVVELRKILNSNSK